MIIHEASEKDSLTLAQMAKKIWDNDNLLELEKEFIDMIHNKNEAAFSCMKETFLWPFPMFL